MPVNPRMTSRSEAGWVSKGRRDEQLHRVGFAGSGIRHVDRVAREIDEDLWEQFHGTVSLRFAAGGGGGIYGGTGGWYKAPAWLVGVPSDGMEVMRNAIFAAVLALMPLAALGQDYAAGLAAYERGDFDVALREWRPLAEQGDAGAQFNLGVMYADGQGEPQDYVTAHMWFKLAAADGHNRDVAASKMTAADISEAQRRAGVCLKSGYSDCD